uniref:Uncharacterized protein n=1 Tax=Colletotrichum fructicola (strain Nara gc5) TaxID=1213859 RepID=L2G4V2_COLFN
MCNYVLYVTQCRQCGNTISQSQSDYVYCPSYKNGISCMRAYSFAPSTDFLGVDECYSIGSMENHHPSDD